MRPVRGTIISSEQCDKLSKVQSNARNCHVFRAVLETVVNESSARNRHKFSAVRETHKFRAARETVISSELDEKLIILEQCEKLS